MLFYIASSWKHRPTVELLTRSLREIGHEVKSFIENHNNKFPEGDFDLWVSSDDGKRCFNFDTESVKESDVVIYIGPSGCDTWAEIGLAWANDIPIYGIVAKGEQVGLMRRMITWSESVLTLIDAFKEV